MALITGFDYDIFISYAHKDNTTVAEEKEGWVRRFYIDLQDKLIRSTGRSDIKIWWDDKKLDGNTYFDQTIKKGLDKAAIIICLNSPSYIQSEWCKKEVNHFYTKCQDDGIGHVIGDEARIIHVQLYNLQREQWLEEFSGRTGFTFFEAEDDLAGDPLSTKSEEFQKNMKGLRNAILRLFKQFQKAEAETKTDTPETDTSAASDKVTIFFGNAPESLGDRPKRIISELEKKGFNVIHNVAVENVATHEKTVEDALKNAALSIHFLDQYPGRSIEGDTPNWFRKKEVEMAFKSDATQLIWSASDFDFSAIEEDAYKQFLMDLADGKSADKSYEFIRSLKGNVIQEVVGHADQVKVSKEVDQPLIGPINVLLDNHSEDRDFAFELNNSLSEESINFFLTPMEDDPKNNNEKLRNYIKKSKKFVFLYGKVEKDWLNARLTTALKILLDYGHSAKDMIVYMTPPQKEADSIKIKEQGIPIQIINSSKDPAEQAEKMKQLIADLKSVGNGK